MSDNYNEIDGHAGLSDDELQVIQEAYRKQKLKENLVGPIISTAVHILVLFFCAVFLVGEVVEKNQTVVITPVQEEISKEEPPPPPPPPEVPPPEPQETLSNDPTVTSDVVPDAADLVGAIDDVSDEPPSTDDNAEADLVNDIKPSASSIISSKMFGGRTAAGRSGALKSYGGSVAGQQALRNALRWLAEVQQPDGSWGSRNTEGFTGLALLVFLAHGETPKSKQFGQTVSKAIQYLSKSKASAKRRQGAYENAVKLYALAEAYTITGNAALVDPIERFSKLMIKGQLPNGSFEYSYKKTGKWDLSLAGFHWQAMHALEVSGLEIPGLDHAVEKSLQRMQVQLKEGFNYGPHRLESRPTLRAVGSYCMLLNHEGHNDSKLTAILDGFVNKELDRMAWDTAIANSLYGWYYMTFALFQKGGKHWKIWNRKFQSVLKKNQNPQGYWEYPSKFLGVAKDDVSNRIHATVFSALMLTVYYRYLPSSSKSRVNKVSTKKEDLKMSLEEEVDIF